MKNKQTQGERVKSKLLRDGFITRNEALRNYISRLSGIIQNLETEGWEFEASYNENKDYVYKLVKTPYKTTTYTLSNGQQIKQIVK